MWKKTKEVGNEVEDLFSLRLIDTHFCYNCGRMISNLHSKFTSNKMKCERIISCVVVVKLSPT
jgi:hypothetical protein